MLRDYPKIRYPSHDSVDGLFVGDHELVILEKMDGAQFRFGVRDGDLIFGSKNHIYVDDPYGPKEHWIREHLFRQDIPEVVPSQLEDCDGAFHHAIRYVQNEFSFGTAEHISNLEELTFFGEALHEHSIEYSAWTGRHPDVDGEMPNVLIYDVWDDNDNEWFSHDAVESLCETVNLETVPEVARYEASELTREDIEIPSSEYRTPTKNGTEIDEKALSEGVVVKRQDGSLRTKYVHEDFNEKNAVTFNDPSKAESDAGEFVATYVTNARIIKTSHKIVDEDDEHDELEMPLMPKLVPRVLEDVMAEHGWEILNSSRDLDEDTKAEIRSKASDKCARVLKNEVRPYQ